MSDAWTCIKVSSCTAFMNHEEGYTKLLVEVYTGQTFH
jgi:hypothetical protein